MSAASPVKIPSYTKHKATGQAVVRINGKDHYLGKFGSAASIREYDRLRVESRAVPATSRSSSWPRPTGNTKRHTTAGAKTSVTTTVCATPCASSSSFTATRRPANLVPCA